MPPRALLLDFDGVIADTENVQIAAWERTFALMGWDVSPEVCARAAEEDDGRFLADLLAERGMEGGDVDGWIGRKQDLARELLGDNPRLFPGVAALVDAVRGRVRLAVVTTSWRENVVAVLGAAGLFESFDLLIAKGDVEVPKPAPNCYRRALRHLEIKPSDAVAVEDSPTGLAAARAARVRCLAVGHRRPAGDWHGNAPFLPDLTDTDAVLAALGF